MIRRILFLDVDGVLNIQSPSYTTAMHRDNLCEPHLVERLNYLCGKDELLEIVISSSWRSDMADLQETLQICGFKFWKRVVDRTSTSRYSDGLKRGEQIKKWLEKNISETFTPMVDAEIFILDDEKCEIEEFWDSKYTFFTDPSIGLTNDIVISILKNKREYNE